MILRIKDTRFNIINISPLLSKLLIRIPLGNRGHVYPKDILFLHKWWAYSSGRGYTQFNVWYFGYCDCWAWISRGHSVSQHISSNRPYLHNQNTCSCQYVNNTAWWPAASRKVRNERPRLGSDQDTPDVCLRCQAGLPLWRRPPPLHLRQKPCGPLEVTGRLWTRPQLVAEF